MIINNKVYNVIKWFVLYFLPAFGTLYFSVSQIWGIPHTEQVLGTITSVTIFLSMVLGISSSSYKKQGLDTDGTMIVDTTDEAKDVYHLQLNNDVSELSSKKTITFKVENNK